MDEYLGEVVLRLDGGWSKVVCNAVQCKHNLLRSTGKTECNLKRIYVDDEGRCRMFEEHYG
jgi:hypothetical protein